MLLKNNILDFMSSFSQTCANVATPEELSNALKASFAELPVKMFSYIHCPPLGAVDYGPSEVVAHFGFPAQWIQFYEKKECCNFDPAVGYAFEKSAAFKWDEFIKNHANNPNAKGYIEAAKRLDVKEGYVFPVFGARYRSGIFSFGFNRNAPTLDDFNLSILQWACQLAHHRFVELKTQSDQAHGGFTAREKEILKWVSLGKSNSEIGGILDISRHTIDGYLKNVYIKLGVSERVSASHRALALGVL